MRPTEAVLNTVAQTKSGAAPLSSHFRFLVPLALVLSATGCANIRPYVPPSEGHITAPAAAKAEPDRAIPPPARVSDFVPPPKPVVKPQTYSVVVNEVQVKDLLFALARDTKQNIDIHPGLTGLVSLNAINETLPAILERVSKQVNLRYRLEGNTIVVSQDLPFLKTFRVNYVNTTRTITSAINVSGEISSTTGTQSSGGSSTEVTSKANNDFWDQLEKNIRAILNSTRLQSLNAEAKADHLTRVKQEQENRVKQIEAASRAGQGAQTLATSVISGGPAAPLPASLVPDDVIVNSVSGTVTINSTERQHQLVQQHIDSIVNAMHRQVLIEATIVEVLLSDAYQGGIDWSRLAIRGGINFTQSLLGGFGAGLTEAGVNFFQIGYVNPDSRLGNISLTVKLLQEFGNARVLSSPKLMALNNQTALLKVVDNLVYFEVRTTPATLTPTGTIPGTTNTTAKTVAIGVVMAVTPQISEDGRVIMIVRPTITRLKPDLPFVKDPNPELARAVPPQENLVPQVQTREMESVLQVGSGQTVILGGLMQDEAQRSRQQLPGADNLDAAGELFRFRNERVTKTELVIFLRPTVVTNPSLESDELKFFQRFLPNPYAPPQTPTPERSGAAR